MLDFAAILAITVGLGGDAPALFVEATASSAVDFVHHEGPSVPPLFPGQNANFGPGAAVADIDGDGDHDIYMCDGAGWPNRLFANNGDGTFTDVTDASGTGDLGSSHMALFLDLDNDGDPDLVVLNDCSPYDDDFECSQLYRNEGDGTFVNVTEGSGFEPVEPLVGGATAGDYDGDGDLDLFIVGWYEYLTVLYRNDGDFRFTDVTDEAGARPEGELFQWTPVMADLDDDGHLDIFCAVDFGEDYLLRGNGDGTFTDVSVEAGTLHFANDMGVVVADLDHDLDLDIYTTNISGGHDECEVEYGCNMVYRNDGSGQFTDATAKSGLGDTAWGWGAWAFDADLDGARDVCVVNGWQQPEWHTPASFFHGDGAGHFVDRAADCGLAHVGNTRSLVPIDLEQDGDVDLVMLDVRGPAAIYENVTPRGDRHWLVVEVEGRTSNRDGVGARIDVTAGGVTQMQPIIVGGSFYAGPPLEAHFGLGSASLVDRLDVRFPSGARVVLEAIDADQRIVIVEPVACSADVDANGVVDFGDLLRVLADWGPCSACPGDLDEDEIVGAADLLTVVEAWGPCSE